MKNDYVAPECCAIKLGTASSVLNSLSGNQPEGYDFVDGIVDLSDFGTMITI